jgi:hypothetical protein
VFERPPRGAQVFGVFALDLGGERRQRGGVSKSV